MKTVFPSVFAILLAIEGSLSTSTLESIPPTINGTLTTCAGHQILLTCSHDNVVTGNTRWIASSPIDCVTDVVHATATAVPCGPFTFSRITLLGPVPLLNSTATATATVNMTDTNIECRGGNVVDSFSVSNISVCVADQPSPPTNLSCENITNGLNVSWEAVSDTSCAMSDVEYFITVVRELDMMTIVPSFTTAQTAAELTNSLVVLQPETTYIVSVQARILMGSCKGGEATTTCETSGSLPTQPSPPTTESSRSPTSSSSPSPAPLSIGAIVGIAIVCVITIIALMTVIVIVIVIVIKKYFQGGKKGSDQGVCAPLAADTEQQHLAVYAMVDKSKKMPAEQPTCTYQDPAKIQHETTASGDVYAVSDKRGKCVNHEVKHEADAVYTEVDKSKRNQGVTYAPIQVNEGKNMGRQQPTDVFYSDIQHP